MESVIIDVIHDEKGHEFFQVILHSEWRMKNERVWPNACSQGGFFLYEDDLNEWIEENADDIKVVTDYRTQ